MVDTFFVGVHQAQFLGWMDVPVMVSRRTLQRRKTLPRARMDWALDSGGFTELSLHGRWTLSAPRYAALARQYHDEIGRMALCAPQDWMCEPMMLRKTGRSLREHQQRTVDNYGELVALDASLPWLPVLQGWVLADYLGCIALYDRVGVDLRTVWRVGLGSVCRRQGTDEAAAIVRRLAREGLRLHAFGFKIKGLARLAPLLVSADSHAWSFGKPGHGGRYRVRVPGCCGHYMSCCNCWRNAQRWHAHVSAGLVGAPEQYAYQLPFDWTQEVS